MASCAVLPDVSVGLVSGLVLVFVVYGVHGLFQLVRSAGSAPLAELVPDPGAVVSVSGDPVPVVVVGVSQ